MITIYKHIGPAICRLFLKGKVMIITIKSWNEYSEWEMTFDLDYIIEHTGKYESYYDSTAHRMRRYIPFTKINARKIFKLIKKHANNYDVEAAALVLSKHKELYEVWKKA